MANDLIDYQPDVERALANKEHAAAAVARHRELSDRWDEAAWRGLPMGAIEDELTAVRRRIVELPLRTVPLDNEIEPGRLTVNSAIARVMPTDSERQQAERAARGEA